MQNNSPLADQLRPTNLKDFCGQSHLLGPEKPLWKALNQGLLHSMILWGPPGVGKTTLAKMIAQHAQFEFIGLSAVMVGLKDVRETIQKAQQFRAIEKKRTVLFIDEVHRFNKTQQDVFLPYIEDGTIIFIGATTENPSFEVNNALLSRCRVYVLKSLQENELLEILKRAISHLNTLQFPAPLQPLLVKACQGDARQMMNLLEILTTHATEGLITESLLAQTVTGTLTRFDKGGDLFYDQISALHKSVRGSNPDAALYWFARMLTGGADPLYIARRVVRMASEDIGNADPKALEIVLNAWDIQQRLGSPEGELAIAQAITYLAVAPKSNATYMAFKAAQQDAKQYNNLRVPQHLRNAPTKLMKTLGNGKNYRYDHDEVNAFAKGQTYFPDDMQERQYYHPVSRGLEIKIQEKLNFLRDKTEA